MPHMKHFEDLLGARWYIRGFNTAGNLLCSSWHSGVIYRRQRASK